MRLRLWSKNDGVDTFKQLQIEMMNIRYTRSSRSLVRLMWGTLSVLMLFVFASQARAGGFSGDFLAQRTGFVAYLELVQSAEGRVMGRYLQRSIGSGSKVIAYEFPVTAVADRDRLVGKIERSFLEGGAIAFSARLNGKTLNIDGGSELSISMQRAAPSAFAAAALNIDAEASRRWQHASDQEAKAQAQRKTTAAARGVDELRKRMFDFVNDEPSRVDALSSVIATHPGVTQRMRELVESIRQTQGASSEAVSKRSMLKADLLHASIESEHAQIDVNNAAKRFHGEGAHLVGKLGEARAVCVNTATSQTLASACEGLNHQAQDFQKLVLEVDSRYRALTEVWNRERPQQEALLREGGAARR